MSKFFWKFIIRLLVLLSFLVTLFVLLFLANGYRFDLVNKNILVTSIIDLTYPNNSKVDVNLDGKNVADMVPTKLFGVHLGKHFLILNKNGFSSWNRKLAVHENLVNSINDIFFWPKDLNNYLKLEKVFKDNEKIYFTNHWIVEENDDFKNIKAMQISGNLNFGANLNPLKIVWNPHLKILGIRGDILSYNIGSGKVFHYDLRQNQKLILPNNKLSPFGHWRIWFNGKVIYSGELNGDSLNIKKKINLNSKIEAFRIVNFGNMQLLKVAQKNGNFAWFHMRNNNLELLTDNAVSGPVYSDYQGLIWLEKSGAVWQENPFGKKNLLVRLSDKIDLIACFSEEGLLLFKQDNNYYLANRSFDNVVKIGSVKDYPFVFINREQIYIVKGLAGKMVGGALLILNIKPGQINFDPIRNKQIEIFSINPFKF